jgi:hypothetical protein
MENGYTYQGCDHTLSVNKYENYRVVHAGGKFDVTNPFRPSMFNVPVSAVNGYTIVLNIIRHEYFVTDKEGVIINFHQSRMNTLVEAENYASQYKIPETMQNTLPLKMLLRDARKGMELKCTFSHLKGKKLTDMGFCPVAKVQSNGLYISRGNTNSFLDLPYSSRVDYNGKSLSVYAGSYRLLNEKEKEILDLWESKRDFEAEKMDALSDSNSQYYRKKFFFEESGYSYLNNRLSTGHLRMDFNYYLVGDKAKRGILLCSYDVRTK